MTGAIVTFLPLMNPRDLNDVDCTERLSFDGNDL